MSPAHDGPSTPSALVIAIDGPSGSGKSSVSKRVATALGFRYLDTGAMYRAATWAVLDTDTDTADAQAVAAVVAGVDITSLTDPAGSDVLVDGTPLGDRIRSARVTGAVSAVSAVPAVRERLVARQREIIDGGGIVVEGRDIGTVVAPDAAVKIFLTASNDARAERRARELGMVEVTAVRGDLDRRDSLDSTRAASPLIPAPDAVHVDTTAMGLDEVVDHVLGLCRAAAPSGGAGRE